MYSLANRTEEVMDEVKVEKGIPIPPDGRTGTKKYLNDAIRKMQVGDSIKFDTREKMNMATARVRSAEPNIKVTTRKFSIGDEVFFRMWRIK